MVSKPDGHKRTSQLIDLSDRAGFTVGLNPDSVTLHFGDGISSQPVDQRQVSDIREMLTDTDADGPVPLYSVYMDLQVPHLTETLKARGLSIGAVVQNVGQIGREYVRSQGHIHSSPEGSNVPYLEIYEFWHGSGLVYLQDTATEKPTEIYLVEVSAGDCLLIPPGWVHIVVNTGTTQFVFGAIYATDATLIYDSLRSLNGPAWRILADGTYEQNTHYSDPPSPKKVVARDYQELGLSRIRPVSDQVSAVPEIYDYVVAPESHQEAWMAVVHDLQLKQ